MKTDKTAKDILAKVFMVEEGEDLQLAITLNPIVERIISAMEEYRSQSPQGMTEEELTERLAELCHKQWVHWMKHLFSKCRDFEGALIIPEKYVKRWTKQVSAEYKLLSDNEKDSDRIMAVPYFALLSLPKQEPPKEQVSDEEIEKCLKEANSIFNQIFKYYDLKDKVNVKSQWNVVINILQKKG